MSQSLSLFRLQQVDSLLDQKLARMKDIELILNDFQEIKEAELKANETETRLTKARKGLKSAEFNTKEQRNKIEHTEAQLFGGKVRNPKVLQDLQNESAALKRYLSVLEERQLESMFLVEEIESELNTQISDIANLKGKKIEMEAALNGEKTKIKKEIDNLTHEKNAATQGIDAETLRIYNKLRDIRGGVAVALVSDKSCSACGSTLNSALLQKVRSQNQLTKCDTCGRILFAG